ncbi:trans-resveratrol di-O-methyltransferase-like [Senna tora]|uniref:Trans-resveratrol di-O-methyltransferase-like n=1 Tax=Senna tora TaxID=362788 RepID=A0A834SG33_9FABA|nr:trans-resveratrol di-O-methyltransferase-like [Senna tora]
MDSDRVQDMFEAQSHLYRLMFNFITSMALKAAIELGIADVIHSHAHPITISELVLALHINPAKSSFLHRLLLKHNVPNLSSIVKVALEPPLSQPFQALGEWFQRDDEVTKVAPFEVVFGKGFWEYGSDNPEFANLFNGAMRSDSGMMNLVIKDCTDVFEGVNSLIDIGGGVGQTARIISKEYPNIKCTVLDLPHVVSDLKDSENLKFVGGDMLQSIPSADVMLFKNVLHCYGDEECVKVLKKCKEAISSGKGKERKVIIIDVVINEKKDMHELTQTKLYFDLLMMILSSGRDREERDWEKLFLEAGFSSYHITPIFGLRSIIQVYP